jgi:hypothetical protein
MLVAACERLSAAHRARSADFPFTTLNEEAAIEDLRRRLAEFDRASEPRHPCGWESLA